jgi:iron complex transport system ATP-binding protein
MLEVEHVGYRAGNRWLLSAVSFELRAGECLVVVGPNGAGKSTLLKLLSGEYPLHTGRVALLGKPLSGYAPEPLARLRASLSQERSTVFPFTAHEVVLIGRTPWQSGWANRPRDLEVVRQALERTGVAHLATRQYPTLSGGEKARVDMARIAAQEPRMLLLDEPANHLDVRQQFEIMHWCRCHAAEGGGVVAVLHDLNLAARHADRILLLREGRAVAFGTPEEVLTADNLQRHFNLECVIWRHPSGCPWVVPLGAESFERRAVR